MRLPIDTSSLTFIAGSDPATLLDMERLHAQIARPVRCYGAWTWSRWVVRTEQRGLAGSRHGRAKGIRMGQPLRVVGLSASPWEIDGRHGISFRAQAVEAATPASAKSPAAA